MIRRGAFVISVVLCVSACRAQDYAIQPVPYSHVDITDEFWAPKREANRTVSIRHLFRKYEEHGRFDSPRAIEAAAYMLAKRRDTALETYVDGLIDKAVVTVQNRLSNPDSAIRLSGNFLEAAVAYYQATGKRKMLDAAIEAADAIDATYGPGKRTYISGHEGLKIGLISLYRQTGDERYWKLARFFLDERGRDDYERQGEYAIDRTYAQDHVPVIRQTEAVGHAVRAMYLYVPLVDESHLYFRVRPPVGEPGWIEYTFKKPIQLSTAEVYWVDDRRFCRLPSSWRVMYDDGAGLKPVEDRSPYTVLKDTFNRVEFEPVTTTRIRIEVEPRTIHYKSGEIGPPDAMFLSKDINWREFGVIELRVK
jgi:hypothetical protein